MTSLAALLFALPALSATPAAACTPPRPGIEEPPPPTEARLAELTFHGASEIVEGVVIEARRDDSARFRIRHVYKGKLRPGAVLKLERYVTPPCGGTAKPPPIKGMHGVLAFTVDPQVDFVPPVLVDRMIADKWIEAGPRDRERLQRVGTGSAPE